MHEFAANKKRKQKKNNNKNKNINEKKNIYIKQQK